MSTLPIRNAFSIDVEDYFQVSALAPHFPRHVWDQQPCRVERNVDRMLGMLADSQATATFFTLGWVAERYPEMVKRIIAGGHELASHGYGHQRATDLTHAEFLDDVTRAKKILEDLGGQPVVGYRAPSFSIGANNLWALDTLGEAGYQYSSSIYPIRHDHYGMPDAPRFAFRPTEAKPLIELPATTIRLFNRNLPAAGGGYFRLLPYQLSRWSINRVNDIDRQPCIFYCHPWEIDPDQPRPNGMTLKTRFRHYVNLGKTESRLRKLLTDFRWGRVDQIFLKAAA
jgi:polysaccharide deacetylase family protein (PEP-CTERM system associated)